MQDALTFASDYCTVSRNLGQHHTKYLMYLNSGRHAIFWRSIKYHFQVTIKTVVKKKTG